MKDTKLSKEEKFAVIERWQQRKLSQNDFCAQENINYLHLNIGERCILKSLRKLNQVSFLCAPIRLNLEKKVLRSFTPMELPFIVHH